ncbi:MAG: hypothetical protein O3A37_04255, partial [Planctomycetota bacterium]|nr:hypothetical protein [Planctomycetota bacterium]
MSAAISPSSSTAVAEPRATAESSRPVAGGCGEFATRHIGISPADEAGMLDVVGAASRAALIEQIVPPSIARHDAMRLPLPLSEAAAL